MKGMIYMFSNVSTIPAITSIVITIVVISLILYRVIKVKLLKQPSDAGLDVLIDRLTSYAVKMIEETSNIAAIENLESKEKAIEYVLYRLKSIVSTNISLTQTEKLLLDQIDLSTIAELATDVLIARGVLNISNTPTDIDNVAKTVESRLNQFIK